MQESDKTVKIIVTVKNRAVIFPTDLDLNAICQDEFHAELILSEHNFADKNVFNSLIEEKPTEFLPNGSRLLINIGLKEPIDENLRTFILLNENPRPSDVQGGFIEIYLKKDLQIKLRGTKKAQLFDCPVFIPALDKTAKSINHAYTLVSEKFEPWRRSHTANVFIKVYWFDEKHQSWFLLEKRRKQAELGELNLNDTKTEDLSDSDVKNIERKLFNT